MKRRTRIVIIIAAVVAACVLAAAFAAFSWATGLEGAARDGKAHAESGAQRLASQDATGAVSEFRAAAEAFSSARAMLGPDWLGGLARQLPWVGRQYGAVITLTSIGIDASNAGAELSLALQETSATPVPEGTSRLSALLRTGRARIDAALVLLADAADHIAELDEEGLDPRLLDAIRSLKDALRDVAPFLDRSRSLLTVERYLFSAPRRILVISQNSAELRPTGGFVGSYGILDVGPEGFTLEKYKDVYSLPDPPGRVTPPPGAKMTNDFSFRDANWWIDFPTSAKAMLGFWKTYRQPTVDGIIALDVVAVRDLMEVTGPVHVASFEETFTAGNLLDRLIYLIEVKSGGDPNKKDVLVALANEVESRLLDSGASDLARSALALANAADQKHVQFYFNDAQVQAAVTGVGWSGSAEAPPGTTDLLAVSNAMTRPGKVNIAMKKAVAYDVALQPDGSAVTTLSLDYSNNASVRFALSSSAFRDYLRVYRAPGTVRIPAPGVRSASATATVDMGLPAIATEFTLQRGKSHLETIVSRVPDAWRTGVAAVVPRSPASSAGADGPGAVAHYRLFVVRQADLQDVPWSVTVSAPDGWRIAGANAWLAASGASVAPQRDDRTAQLFVPLSGDLVFDITMERR
jgi:hypothetical protein